MVKNTSSRYHPSYVNFFNTCQSLFCIIGFEGKFRQLNPAWEKLLGYPTDKLVNTVYLDLVHPEDRETTQRHIDQLCLGSQSVIFTSRFSSEDGTYRTILWQATLSPFEYAFYASGIDITQQEETIHLSPSQETGLSCNIELMGDRIKQLPQQLKTFKHIVENAREATFISTLEGQLIYINKACEKLLRHPLREAVNHHYQDYFTSDTLLLFNQEILPKLRENEHWEGNLEIINQTGRQFFVNICFTLVKDENGQPFYYFALLQDISSQKVLEINLRYKQELYEMIFQNTPVAITYKDTQNNIMHANAYAAQTFGIPLERLRGLPVEELVPEYANQYYSDDLEIIRSGEPKLGVVANFLGRYWQVDKYPYKNAEGDILGVLEFSVDITTNIQAQETMISEKAVAQYERLQYETIFNMAPMIIMYKNRHNRILRTNDYTAKFFKISADQLAGISIRDLLDEYREQHYTDDLEVIHSGRPKLGVLEQYAGRYWQIDRIPYYDTEEKILGVILFGVDITEHVRMEHALQQNQYRLRLSIENLPVLIAAMDKDFNFVLWNHECERVTGYRKDEIVNNHRAWRLLYPNIKTRKEILTTGKSMLEKYGGFRCWELEIICKDNSKKTIEWSASSEVKIADFFLFVGQETTDRESALRQLCENEARLRLLVENMPVMLNAYNSEGQFIMWNRQCEKVTGYKVDEMVGSSKALRFLYPDPKQYALMQQKLVRVENYHQYETELTCKDGSKKYIAWSCVSKQFPIPGWHNWMIGEDVTAFKKMQEFFVKNNALLSTAVDNINIGICVTDARQQIVYTNRAYCAIYGYTEEELLNQPLNTVMAMMAMTCKSFVFRHYFSFLAGAHGHSVTESLSIVRRDETIVNVQIAAHRMTEIEDTQRQTYVIWTVTQLSESEN